MASAATPQPMEGLLDAGPPQFIIKTYEIVEDSNTNHIVSWSSSNVSFVVWDPQTFSISLLPRYFKHNNFSSFVRQLNVYGFRKVDPDRWEFANEGFLRGERHLLKNIRRRKQLQLQASQALNACVEVGRSGLDGEADRVGRDKQVLMVELVKLRQKQQNTREYLHAMEQRLRKTEMKQQQVMMSFWARDMQNPHFVQQFVQQKDKRKEFEEGIARKKRRFVKMKPEEFGDKQGLCDCLNINPLEKFVEEGDHHENRSIINNVKFWEDFWNEDIEEEGEQREGLDMLVELLGFKGSSSK